MIEEIMRECEALVEDAPAKSEQELYHEERTAKHIALVQAAAKKIADAYPELKAVVDQAAEHDASKLVEPERTPYVKITWRHKIENEKGDYDPYHDKGSYKNPGMLDKEDENKATLIHIMGNDHHPEFWNKEEANLSAECRDKSDHCIDATKMPDVPIAHMVSDWQAMSEELKKNTAREWFEKQKDVRWHFSPHQEELINKLLTVFETGDK